MPDRWERFVAGQYRDLGLGVALDLSAMGLSEGCVAEHTAAFHPVFAAMEALEQGAVANPDEGRRVGHYWLRDPDRAPDGAGAEIQTTRDGIAAFAGRIQRGDLLSAAGTPFRNLLLIGIGGSALGPQLLADALAPPQPPLRPFFMDNTDPAGIRRVLDAGLRFAPAETLVVVASKSGGTTETWNGLRETEARLRAAGLDPARQLVALTQGSGPLYERSVQEQWLAWFPIWDWVGGRTSVTSPVGLLPTALLGLDTGRFLAGAREMDRLTRVPELSRNPAALLALAWFQAGRGRGDRTMVILPYCDRLRLLGAYLQQLVMESLGKRQDLQGRVLPQGLAVFGNKGSTDQHSYLQQLLDGPDNFFLTLVRVLENEGEQPVEVAPGVTSGDCLDAFLQGTRRALADRGKRSLTLTLHRVDEASLGAVIALYERAVGFYASLIGINAYHQPAVEAMKQGARSRLALQQRVLAALRSEAAPATADRLAAAAAATEEEGGTEAVYLILERLAANPARGVAVQAGGSPADDSFSWRGPA